DVAFLRDRQQAIRSEPVARLADRADDGYDLGRRLVETRQVRDLVVRAVKRGADQAVHAGADPDVLHVALALRLRHAGQQHAGLRDDVAPRLEPDLARAARILDLGQPAIERLEVERPLPGPLRHAEPAAEVEVADLRKALEQRDELLPGVAPGLRRQHAAARVRMEPDDLDAGLANAPLQLVELEQRHAELRVGARRAHVLVMAAALPGIDANEHLRAAEQLRPRLERVEVIQREPHALLERPLVLVPRREIRREQNPLAVDVREQLEHALDLARRYALEVAALLGHDAQHFRVRVRLHRIEDRVHRLERAQRVERAGDAVSIVDVRRAPRLRDPQELRPAIDPPRLRKLRRERQPARELLPRGAEHAAFEARDELRVELLNDALRMLGADDEREVQIVRRLRDEVHMIFLEELEDGRQLVHDRADAPPHERDRRAVVDDGDAAQAPQVLRERLEPAAIRAVRADVHRHGDAALRGRDQVDGDAVLA